MLKTPLGRFRAVGLLEGLSFLVLLFIAMPLKYLLGMPLAVKVVGWTHGLLFVLYVLCLLQVSSALRWPLARVGVAFVAALLPFGPFVLERRLRDEEQATARPTA